MSSELRACVARAAVVLMAVAVVVLGAPLPSVQAAATDTPVVLGQGVGLAGAPSRGVRRVQRILERRGFDLGAPGVDGRFGPLTAAAVRRAQARYGLAADGVVGPKTRRLLRLLSAAVTARHERRSGPARQQSRPPATTPSPQSQSRPQTVPAQRSGREPTARSGRVVSDGASPVAIVLAALAAGLAAAALAVAVARTRRRGDDDPPLLAAIDRDLYLEGTSDRPDVGAFRGFALATAVPADGGDDAGRVRYLVDDPRKPAPVWVRGADVRRSPSQLRPGAPVIGYVTVDRDAAREQQAFIEIEALCERAGWKLEEIVRDRDSGRIVGRPGLMGALERIAAGDAHGLIISDARSVVRSLSDLGALLEWFRDAQAALIAVDLDLDTATIEGHQTAATLITVAGWEGERTVTRARRGLARVQTPDRAGGPRTPDDHTALIERIHAMRDAGMSLQAIADQLASENVPPLSGTAHWRPATVQTALDSPHTTRTTRDQLPTIPTHDHHA
jgi:DNA invertase Pin-like site-specific DNA recombinase/peptidoglycan hydrolase-like protein with peptidoglycan-binding domain